MEKYKFFMVQVWEVGEMFSKEYKYYNYAQADAMLKNLMDGSVKKIDLGKIIGYTKDFKRTELRKIKK